MVDVNELIDMEKIRVFYGEFQYYDGYLPLYLHRYIDRVLYLNNLNEDDYKEYLHRDYLLRISDDPYDFLLDDLINWVNENPRYESILMQ